MKVLNLTTLEESEIKYKISPYPDGQQNIILNKDDCLDGEFILTHKDCIVKIKSRLNNFQDLELIICTTKSLRNLGVREIHLYTPYFLGSRSDRRFEEGSCNYLKDIICPIINSLNFESVTVLDPHSYVLEACLNNFKKIDNRNLVGFAIKNIYDFDRRVNFEDYFTLMSPDAGATHKIYKVAEQADYKGSIITCSKERDENGKLTKVDIPKFDISKDIIIIDDICDGGQTFINIAEKINSTRDCLKHLAKSNKVDIGKLYLIVTHGIFSKGFDELSKYFDGIYCTNSYNDLEDYNLEFGDTSFSRQQEFLENKIKQLNVF